MSDLSNSALSDLVGEIYDCTLHPSQWDDTLRRLAHTLACEKVILALNDLRGRTTVMKKTVGWEPFWLQERMRHLAEVNHVLDSWLQRRPSLDMDRPFVASRELSAPQFDASLYVRHCLQPQGIADVAHFFLIAAPDHFSEVVLFWHESHGIATARELELGSLLLPHLRRAVTIGKLLDVAAQERDWALGALDVLRPGVLLINEGGTVLYANPSAERMLQDGQWVARVGGVLRARSAAARRELAKALALAACNESAIGHTGTTICLSEPGLRPVFAHVLPMAGGELRPGMRPGAAAAVFIDSGPDGTGGAAALATAFDLTPAETRVLAGLMAGRRLSVVAAELGISGTTARTHLNHIFGKTGISRQADLMRLAVQAAYGAGRAGD